MLFAPMQQSRLLLQLRLFEVKCQIVKNEMPICKFGELSRALPTRRAADAERCLK